MPTFGFDVTFLAIQPPKRRSLFGLCLTIRWKEPISRLVDWSAPSNMLRSWGMRKTIVFISCCVCLLLVSVTAAAVKKSNDSCKSTLEMVVLRNGREVPSVVVRTTWIALEKLFEVNPVAAYELVQLARNPDHEVLEIYSGAGKVGPATTGRKINS